ncbi:MAG TPA: hypothetical protein VN032_02875 [Thermoanaerobaculia bacterium]|jgi:hypothetical protein|nr:hypothetical protein [Thermoanaerobaculia bacterium]
MTRSFRTGFLWFGLLATAAALEAHDGAPFSLSVLVDGAPVPEYASRGRIYIEALKGRDFTIRLSNPTSGRVAVALSVDGRNVVDAKRTTELAAAKWVLGPGQTIDVPGWQVSGETARKFFFTETSRSYANWLGDTANVGTIEAVFFREKARQPIVALREAQASAERGAQAPAAGSSGPSAAPAPTLKEEKARAADENAATGIGDRTRFPVQWVAFEEDPTPAARVALRYEFRSQLVRLGVLPRDPDGLFAREHASGFERGYAPDPYGHR